jgi:hypothetical protein
MVMKVSSLTLSACILVLLCLNCGRQEAIVRQASFERISIPTEVQESDANKVNDLFAKVEIIPLQTTDSSFLKEARRVLMGDYIYYLSGIEGVFIFERNGTFLKSIPRGNGPGELRQALDIQLDDEGDLYVLEYLTISRYGPLGEFIEEYRINTEQSPYVNPSHFAWFDKDNYFLWVKGSRGLSTDLRKEYYHLHHIKNGQIDSSAFPVFSMTFGAAKFIQSGGKYYVTPGDYGNYVTELSKEQGMGKPYFIDFGEKNVDTTRLSYGFGRETGFDNYAKIRELFSASISNFMEMGDYFYFQFVNSGKFQFVFYNKTSGEFFSTPHDKALIDGLLPFRVIDWDRKENQLLAIVDPAMWLDYLESNIVELSQTPLLDADDIALLKGFSENSNPYLMRIEIK